MLKEQIQLSPLWPLIRDWRDRKAMKTWEERGKPLPPPHPIKQKRIQDFASQYNLKVMVETGTYLGDMIEKTEKHFDAVYSIEISSKLHEHAKRKFKGRSHINLLLGDSGKLLKEVVEKLEEPTLFWLDAHYSHGITGRGDSDCPIYDELRHIFTLKCPFVILVDDARDFGKDPAYPPLEDLEKFIQKERSDYKMSVDTDCIIIVPS